MTGTNATRSIAMVLILAATSAAGCRLFWGKNSLSGGQPPESPASGQEWADPASGITFVWVPAGSFTMGSDKGFVSSKPAHKVTFAKGFWMGKYEVTQAQWKAVMGNNPSDEKGDTLPVVMVSWNQALAFVDKLNAKGGGAYRMPSEAEWEYAYRAGTATDYYWGDAIDGAFCWYEKNADVDLHAGGLKKPNAWGLYDMAGNVSEWCADPQHDDYEGAPSDGSPWTQGAPAPEWKVLRGGSYIDSTNDNPSFTAHKRGFGPAASAFPGTGLRIVHGV